MVQRGDSGLHQRCSSGYLPPTPRTVSRPPATRALLIATEAKALSILQRSDLPLTLASRVTRDDTTSCHSTAEPKATSVGMACSACEQER